MKATEAQKKQWTEKYGKGNLCELSADGKYCYIVNPSLDIVKMKAVIAARQKSVQKMVDSLLNNCWVGGDESFKTDDRLKLGLEDQIEQLLDIPEYELADLENGNILISVDGESLEVKKADRMDLAFAEDRDRDNKPLARQIYLMDRIVIDQKKLADIKAKPKVYLSMLLATGEVKDKKYVSLKKF